VSEEKPPVPAERAARNNRIVLVACAVFFGLCAVGVAAYAVHSYRDYAVRTSPPDGRTTEVPVEQVTTGRHCSSGGKSTNCSPEYSLTYTVDGEQHTTPVRIEIPAGELVHAFEGSDGRWYVTEDPGFGNSRFAWLIWGAFAGGALLLALLCVRGLMKSPKPT
jgi:hypothetical protein